MEPDRLKAKKSMDFEQFIDNVYALLETVWGKNWGMFTINKPTISDSRNIPMPHIVYSLKEAQPGLVGKETREIAPRQREVYKETSQLTGEETTVQVMGRVMDCTVEFFVYSDNNREAMLLTKSLREVLEKYKGVLMGNGMQNMWLKKDYERNMEESAQDKLASRGLTYLVRLEELFRNEQDEISEIQIRMKVAMNQMELANELPSQDSLDSEIIESSIIK